MMGKLAVVLAGMAVLAAAGSVRANVFNMGGTRNPDGSWNGVASLETVPVGDPGNVGELSGGGGSGLVPERICGAVDYAYRIGKYEVTAGQYCEFLNAVAATDTYGLYNEEMSYGYDGYGCRILRSGSPGSYTYTVAPDWANRPVNYVSWADAARFVNWLHNGQPVGLQDSSTTEDGAYALNGAMSSTLLAAVSRKQGWKWAIPSEDEWYKAAYYDPAAASYYDYPISSSVAPTNQILDPDTGNSANCRARSGPDTEYTIGPPYWRTEVGEFERSYSPYGTFDQCGNVWEWNEAIVFYPGRGYRDGCFATFPQDASSRSAIPSDAEGPSMGFRVVQSVQAGDINGDGYINAIDLLTMAHSWARSEGDVGFDPRCDLNGDGMVNVIDLLTLARAWSANGL